MNFKGFGGIRLPEDLDLGDAWRRPRESARWTRLNACAGDMLHVWVGSDFVRSMWDLVGDGGR